MNSLKDNTNYIIQRSDKICLAIYVLTNHVKDIDPIKWSIRTHAINLVSFTNNLNESRDGERQIVIDMSVKEATLVLSEITLASRAGLVSYANWKVVSDEIALFTTELKDFMQKDTILSPLQQEHMRVDMPAPSVDKMIQLHKKTSVKDMSNKGQNKGHVLLNKSTERENIKDTKNDLQHDERRKIILEMLKDKDFLSVKDIALLIKNCSEKTIQRELIFLVKSGVLYKTGDRRWSTYSLVKKSSAEPL